MLKPTSDKLDVDRLLADIPKWQKWLSVPSQQEWSQFLKHLESLVNHPEMNCESEWYLDQFHAQSETVNCTGANQPILNNEREECMVCSLLIKRKNYNVQICTIIMMHKKLIKIMCINIIVKNCTL